MAAEFAAGILAGEVGYPTPGAPAILYALGVLRLGMAARYRYDAPLSRRRRPRVAGGCCFDRTATTPQQETPMPRILTPATHSEETLQIAYDLLPAGWDLATAPHGRPEFWDLLKDTEYYIGAGQFPHGPDFYQKAPKLRIVQTLSAGYNTYDLDAARAAGVPICNNGGANSTAVAEHAMMLMLAVCRRLIWQHEGVSSGRWRGNDFSGAKLYELEDKTLGIIGLGNIGKKVARRAKAFDMFIKYYDINRLTTDQEDALGVRFALFPELIKTSDIITLHVPLDKSTHNLIGERELGWMKPTAILINTCRGPVVDEKALYNALRDEKILGAGLDVMVEEPPKPDHELFTLKNITFSPHGAGPTWDNHWKRWRNAFDNFERVARGQKPFWIVPELRD
jgi:phosphoglycerate dehydrogenase-like enzyme